MNLRHGLRRAHQQVARCFDPFNCAKSDRRAFGQLLLAETQQHPGRLNLDGEDHQRFPVDLWCAFWYQKIKFIDLVFHMATAPYLPTELPKHQRLRERLLVEFPDIDAETLSDTLEGLTDLREMLAEVIRSALDDEALASGLSTRLSDMKARIERFETSAKRKRELALKAMNAAEIPKLLVADFTASLRHGAPTLEVIEETKIPAAYWKPQPPKLDRQGLLAALKAGAAIDGAVLEPPCLQLSVRTK